MFPEKMYTISSSDSRHAQFSYTVDRTEKIVRVFDECAEGRLSVTNDAEYVIHQLVRKLGSLIDHEVIYRDSTGRWDGLHVANDRFAGFYPLREETVSS